MNLSCKELKRQARETLNGRYGLPMNVNVMTGLMVFAASFPFNYSFQKNPGTLQLVTYYFATFIISLLSIVLTCGIIRIHLDMSRGKERTFADLFYYFSRKPDRLILAQLSLMLKIFAAAIPAIICAMCYFRFPSLTWMALMIIAFLVSAFFICYLSLTYSLIYYFLVDNDSMGVSDAFCLSREHMKGNRCRLLYIAFSFIGMALLGLLSFGIGFLWIYPYISQTIAVFYRNIIGEVS